ncbi:hypothetical protein LTR47_009898 [Exophiala xenobiotica]|nr:hypothetical protein LTR47_009898 [Exophiala xenobiotica]KAK5243923.1 hypothetical protein LTS06_010399 [Exophiala xenobiotica]KAK5282193.1 hypothetical protein LTR40_003675 [Exophiala xenobiotica]KAK5347946.1 hypothetical protein LTR61_008198 [Exophiala xenobiotica]KAK5361445.1 hypothetical protein LTS03_010398 [Exophiala xenobiotica]
MPEAMDMAFPTIPEDEFVLYVRIIAKPDKGNELATHLRKLIRLTESEPGTLAYVISQDDQNPDWFHVYERYTGREAFEQHIASREFVDFAESGLIASPPGPKMLKPLKPW